MCQYRFIDCNECSTLEGDGWERSCMWQGLEYLGTLNFLLTFDVNLKLHEPKTALRNKALKKWVVTPIHRIVDLSSFVFQCKEGFKLLFSNFNHASTFIKKVCCSFTEKVEAFFFLSIGCFCSVSQSCPTLCDPMDCITPSLLVHPSPSPEVAQVHVHFISDAIWPSHPLMPSSPSALHLSQYWYQNQLNFSPHVSLSQ